MCKERLCVLIGALLLLSMVSAAAVADTVNVAFWKADALYFALRPVSGADPVGQTLQYLLAGPDKAEAADGVLSSIPAGTKLVSVKVADGRVTVDLSPAALFTGVGDAEIEFIYRQVAATLRQFYPDLNVAVTVDGKPLWSYVPPAPKIEPRTTPLPVPAATGALSGKTVTLSPGHGYYWYNSYWTTQRGGSCGYDPEDFHNILIARYLKIFLQNDGATVMGCRDVDMNAAGAGPNGQPWWKQAAYVWLWHTGYPADVFASYTGDNPPGSASNNETNDDIRARPLASDYDNTDIYLSIHTNALSGYCVGGTCPTGTETYYDASSEHAAWGAVSQQLGNAVNSGIMAAVQANVNDIPYGPWTCHGTCVKDSSGAYGEIRIPDRAATLTELAFHDTCDRDALLIEDPFFQSVAMWGMYEGVCDYFGVSPTYPIYSSEYVSDTIPTTMTGGQTVSVSVTFRNKGVVWQDSRGFRLGAVGDSDPFATTRQTISGSVDPNGTYTFTFDMTAPQTEGDYTTDWQMVRDGYAWFGDVLTKTVHVEPPADTEPPSVPQNLTITKTWTTYVDMSWDASTDNELVTGYNVYRNGAKIDFVTGTTYHDDNLMPGTSYTYQVSAVDSSSNESALSDPVTTTTVVDVTPPAAPTGVTASGTTTSRIDVSWNAAWDNLSVVSYNVFRDGALVGSPTGTSYADTGLAPGSTHTYRVSAVDQSGNESNRSLPVVARTFDQGNTVLWSDDFEYSDQASYAAVWQVMASPGLTWSTAQSASPTHSVEETNVVMSSVHDLTPAQSQISVGTFVEFKYYDPAGATNVRHYGQVRSYSSGGHAGTLQELLSTGAYNASGVNTGKYSGRAAFGIGGTYLGWFTLNQSRSAGWHTMRIDVVGDANNPISPGKGLATWSVDGQVGSENNPIVWKPFTCIVLGSGLSSTTAGNYYYDDVKYGVQSALQRINGPNAVESPCGTVTITWTTDLDSTSRVDYGPTASYGQTASDAAATTNHSITLTGLTPASTYHFKVTSTAAGKTDSVSEDFTFTTAASSLAQLKSLPDGTNSAVCSVVVSAVLPNGFYVQDVDRTCGMKVIGTLPADVGSLVKLTGDLDTVGGERVLQNAVLTPAGTGAAPIPLGMNSGAIGGAGIGANIPGLTGGIGTNNIGLLIKTWGKVTEVGTEAFWIDDGRSLTAADGKTGLKVSAAGLILPAVGDFVVVTGISGAEDIGGSIYPVLRPRTDDDVAKTGA